MQKSSTDTTSRSGKDWRPTRFLETSDHATPYAVLILNQPIENPEIFLNVYKGASYKICADGGANRLRSLLLQFPDENLGPPNAICGDLDSLNPEVEGFFKDQGTLIEKDPDQYSTDFTKCLKQITRVMRDTKPAVLDVAVFGGLGGRGDQAFSLIHRLYIANNDPELSNTDIYLITPESILVLLREGFNRIYTPVNQKLLGENVGIIPIGKPSIITTRGLEWDVREWPTEFGGQISTSNHIRSACIEIDTTERVLLTVELGQKS
ncbi:hypothetical protein MMC06_005990 [Schaereria dolodes]|nr:hypothetical protein [Schaereria dolodes]